ncbi:helix-turn-helix domain-containing protein [Roseomonas sp. GC11]|uniref:helix-turn-helix domain-containing protein n=1 Tax=Roseomonas sp. GC11 TaxID=2950546 RepID=UPI00210EA313|nr:helix-turn-helix domain-containing protein [Roseomonas sp. GC11]MCQ4162654.1 helix-turn-helix domain-containing protein [Roseomonas sp. GC11]
MSGRDRLKMARKGSVEPFATLRCDALLLAACTLPAAGLRAVLLANANWVPNPRGAPGGKAVLSYQQILFPRGIREAFDSPAPAGLGRSAVAEGLRQAEQAGWLIRLRNGTRPGTAGSAIGAATEWDVPHRHGAAAPRLVWPSGMPRAPEGKIRLHAERIRQDVATLTPNTLRVFAYMLSHGDRTAEGALAGGEEFPLSASVLQKRTKLSRAIIHKAIQELIAARKLFLCQAGVGRKAATYRLARAYQRFSKNHPGKGSGEERGD